MRKLAIVLALLALAAFPAFAATDNYHYNSTMKCSDCHSMHASAHEIDGTAVTSPVGTSTRKAMYFPASTAPQPHLLKAVNVCKSCHDAQTFAPDVIGGNTNTYNRSAGGVHELAAIPAGAGGHVIGSTARPQGYLSTAAVTGNGGYYSANQPLECYSCHSPHGGTAFRNLGPYKMLSAIGAGADAVLPTVSKTPGFVTTTDVTILGADAYDFQSVDPMIDYYGRNNVVFANNQAVTFNGTTASNRMDQFCGVCHGAFHGGSKTADTTTVSNSTDFVRHPTSTVLIGALPTATVAGYNALVAQQFANLKVYQATATATSTTDSPGCLSCHKAHGNSNPFALVYPGNAAADTTEIGAGTYKSLCKTCHSVGGTTLQ